MTTIVAVRKGNKAVIGADTLITYGDQLESASLIRNHSKLIQVGETWLAVTGHAALDLILRRIFHEQTKFADSLGSSSQIFRAFVDIHKQMKDEFFLKSDEDKDDEFESMHMNVLVANSSGIFGVCSKRSVFEYTQFYAFGAGDQYALGAMRAVYDRLDDPEEIARIGLETAAEFDNSTGLPVQIESVSLFDA